MRKELVLLLLIVSLLGLAGKATAQVAVNFNAPLYGRTLDGLSFAQIHNSSGQNKYSKIKITIRENNAGTIATVVIPFFLVHPGANSINRAEFSRSTFSFAQNQAGEQLKQTGRIPGGDYEFCFEVSVGDIKTQAVDEVFENCFSSPVQPATPLLLINPAPDDESCSTRPAFTWQPPMPFNNQTRFRIIVCEKGEKQSDIEAINYNIPVINVAGVPATTLLFPPKTPDLKKEKSYVWQVTAYQDQTIVTKSEIWEFSIKCAEEKKSIDTESYREAKEQLDGSVYYAYGKLKFFFYNPYTEGGLNYSIDALAGTAERIKKFPELKMLNGYNQFEINLEDIRAFKDGKNYLLKIWLQNNKMLQVRFIYKESE